MKIFNGTAVSEGLVKGSIVRIDESTDLYQITDNNILLIYKSSPKWVIPLMNASGIISEIGGYASHMGILSREMAKPCVSEIEGIYSFLKTGDIVLLDGYKGEVTVYDSKSK